MKKKIVRLTESDLHSIVKHTVVRVLKEENDGMLVRSIADEINRMPSVEVENGENDIDDIDIGNGMYGYVVFNVLSDPYVRNANYAPGEPEDVVDDIEIEITEVGYSKDGELFVLQDDGSIKSALENSVTIMYNPDEIPSEEDYFYSEY